MELVTNKVSSVVLKDFPLLMLCAKLLESSESTCTASLHLSRNLVGNGTREHTKVPHSGKVWWEESLANRP